MKLKLNTSVEEKRAELVKIKSYMEIGIFIIAAIEIFCEFFTLPYVDYIIMSISFVEYGLFVHGFFLNIDISRPREFSVEKYDALIEFHNTFISSIIVPMIFIFSNNNTSFENTRIYDPELLKKITVVSALGSMLYYKSIHYRLKRKTANGFTEDQKARLDRRTFKVSVLGFFLDMVVMMCVFCLFMGMLLKAEKLAAASMLFAILIVANLILLNRVEEKKHIFKISFLVLTVLYIFFGTYNIYLEEAIQEYHYEKADYYYLTEWPEGGKLEQYCRIEDGEENQDILKYVMVYTSAEGEVQMGGSVYEFTAIKAVKGIFRWYDDGYTAVGRSWLEEDEIPAVILVSREKTLCDAQLPMIKFLKNDNYAYLDDQGIEHEWLVEGEDRIRFRNTFLSEIETIPDSVETLFDELKFD